MRAFEDVEQRWTQLFNTSIGVDLRQALREDSGFDPCEEGLRSVCWRSFLLYGPLSQGTWTKKLAESRSAYTSLKDHFLRYIDRPNELHSSTDPLTADETSPWSTLRQDEASREEIFQDVTRCMQENYFFREPLTQRRLLDILFIYSKLNPDTGYRQGMHELLAPILWVIDQDAIESSTVAEPARSKEGADFMLDVLNGKYAEHDAFSLFCAVMQTAKGFYELGSDKDPSAIVGQSQHIHDDLLAAVDPDLAHHLQIVGVLPQIYSIRWIRLLFGREFDFKDVLKIWDLLFAENFTRDIVDMTCVAILLRVRWQLIEADYTDAITMLTRFKLPHSKEGPRSLVKDASYLSQNKTVDGGAGVIQYYSGLQLRTTEAGTERSYSPAPSQQRQNVKKGSNVRSSPSPIPVKTSTPQKQLENIFAEVSGTLQRRTEGWSVSKAVIGAVGEVRRNVNNFQAGHSREASVDKGNKSADEERRILKNRLEAHEKRNRSLSGMLDAALDSLRTCRSASSGNSKITDDVFDAALARIQFVSVFLADSDISIPQEEPYSKVDRSKTPIEAKVVEQNKSTDLPPQTVIKKRAPRVVETDEKIKSHKNEQSPVQGPRNHQARPSLADSSFSFMLGENRHRSSFVSSVSDLPEQRRGSDANSNAQKVGEDDKAKHDRKQSEQIDGFTMSSWQ